MLKHESLRYDLFIRVRNFGQSHQREFPETSDAGRAFAIVAEAAADIDRQSAARLAKAKIGTTDRAVARNALWERLAAIVRSARRRGGAGTGVTGVFQLPRRRSDRALRDAAHAIIGVGDSTAHQWVRLGLPETAIADLRHSVEALDLAIGGHVEGRKGQATARITLKAALARGLDALRDLDVIVANTPQLDPVVLSVWREIRRVNPKTRVVVDEALASPATPAAASTSPPQDEAIEAPKPAASSSPSLVALDETLRRVS